MEDAAYVNSLVGDYLASVNPQLAKKFKKESKASPLPPGSPNLAQLVKEFQKTSPAKRKLSLSNGHTPAKKTKKVKAFFFRKNLFKSDYPLFLPTFRTVYKIRKGKKYLTLPCKIEFSF